MFSAALAGIPALRAFVWPAFRRPARADWIKLGEADLFALKVPTRVDFVQTVNDAWVANRVLRSVWVYSEDGERFTVYNARCTHLGCSVGYNKDKQRFHCPCHEGVFDVKTGAVLGGPPPRSLDRLETKIDNGDLYCAYRDFRVGIAQRIAV
jgi:quinol---cytochrome c reductase iron-sulfur subunit, bacillus type